MFGKKTFNNYFGILTPIKLKPALLVCILYAAAVYGSMAMMSIGAGIVLAVAIYSKFYKKELSLIDTVYHPMLAPSLFLSVACALSLLWVEWSGFEYYGVKPKINFIEDIWKLWHVYFSFILYAILKMLKDEEVYRILRWWFLFSFIIIVYGFFQHYFPLINPMQLPHTIWGNYVQPNPYQFDMPTGSMRYLIGKYHATGLSGFHLSFAAIIAFPTMIALLKLSETINQIHKNKKLTSDVWSTLFLSIFVTFMFLLVNYFTYSKVTWVSIPLMLIGFSIYSLKGKPRVITLICTLIFLIFVVNSDQLQMRLKGSDTVKERISVWKANLDMVLSSPLLGVGWHHNSELSEAYYKENKMVYRADNDVRPFISHAHNNIIDQWSSTGTLGLFGFLWWNGMIIFMAYRSYKSKKLPSEGRMFALGIFSGWVVLHFNGLTQTNYWDAKVMHQLSYITAVTLWLDSKSQNI